MYSGVVPRPSFLPSLPHTDHGDDSAKSPSMRVCSGRSGLTAHCPVEDPLPHFLAACFLCKKQLGNNRDIFMYRGDTAFCSEECRQEQIYMEESKEKDLNLSRKKQQQPTSPSRDYNNNNNTKSKNAFHAGAVAAA